MNCQNFSGKCRKFSRSRMMKRTAPLSSLNFETVRIFYEILGDGFRVKLKTGFFKNFEKNGKYIKNIQLG